MELGEIAYTEPLQRSFILTKHNPEAGTVLPVTLAEAKRQYGGQAYRLVLYTLQNGLRYLGLEPYDGSEGKLSGFLHPVRPTILSTVDFGLGAGFKLTEISLSVENGIVTYVNKGYEKDNKYGCINYRINPALAQFNLYLIYNTFRTDDLSQQQQPKRKVIDNSLVVSMKRDSQVSSTSIFVGKNISTDPHDPQYEHVTFQFDQDGNLDDVRTLGPSASIARADISRLLFSSPRYYTRFDPSSREAECLLSIALGDSVHKVDTSKLLETLVRAAEASEPVDPRHLLN